MATVISDSRNTKYGTSVYTVTIANAGSGYTAADVLTINSGDTNATVTVGTVNGSGGITSITRTAVGSGYTAGTYGVTGGTGTSATITITVQAGLGCVNGWYRVESANMGMMSVTGTQFSTTTPKYINVTFANSGNCQGLLLCMFNPVWSAIPSSIGSDMIVMLQEKDATAPTMTIASPCVVTLTGHTYLEGQKVAFTTTGALPTGVVAGTTYYVRNPAANVFNLSSTPTGSLINTSGTQSGTHTLWATRTEKTLTRAEITPSTYIQGGFVTPFKFATPYAVDTTASKWRFSVAPVTAAANNWYLKCSDSSGTNPFYVTWCDNAVSFTNNDTMVVMDTIYIDKSFKTIGTLGTGDTAFGISAVICSNAADPTPDNVSKLLVEPVPQGSWTWTIDGMVAISSQGGIRAGTSSVRIPIATPFTISFTTKTVGTASSCILGTNQNAGNQGNNRCSLFLYGEIPTYQRTTLNGAAAAAQANITTTDTTGWVAGDLIGIGKITAKGITSTETNAYYTIQSISGTSITLTGNIQLARSSGASVVNLSRYGVKIISDNASIITSGIYWNNFVMSGVSISDYAFTTTTQTSLWGGYIEDSAYTSTWLVEDCSVFRKTVTSGIASFFTGIIFQKGLTFNRVNFYSRTITGSSGIYAEYYPTEGTNFAFASGTFTMSNCSACCVRFNQTASVSLLTFISKNCYVTLTNNYFESTDKTFYEMEGLNVTFTGNYVYGSNDTAGGAGAVSIGQLIKPTSIGSNTYENNLLAQSYSADSTITARELASTFTSNTTDIKLNAYAYIDYIQDQPVGNLSITTTQLPDTLVGSSFKVIKFNAVAGDDRNYNKYGYIVATGSGLTDTTVHTSGTGKYGVRFEPTSSANLLTWEYDIPTGDIQNKTMFVGVWCKINSATYYAGTHQLPRLTITYDQTSTAYAQAAQSTAWQLLIVPITPTTTYGQITVTHSARTDATTTNAYVYWDDAMVAYPPNVSLDLGGMDLWADALPVVPPIAIPISAKTVSSAVWEELTSSHTTTQTIGKMITDINNTVGDNQGLILAA